MAGVAALINIWLAIRIGQVRAKEKIMMGDGGNKLLVARMRAQANFIENTPLFLLLLALVEFSTQTDAGQSQWWLWLVGGIFMAGRVAHGLGMDGTFKPGRHIGAATATVLLLGMAVYAIALPFLPHPVNITTENVSDEQ
ncbi:MAG: MAPEG family protein [Alphaproteobacteria bacterium]|nr:MAPEG family protein [Alphaproteobacteria bacterium]